MINWGIIGCGDVTEVKSGPAFNKVPGSSLVAVMRRNAVKAKDYAGRHHVPKWYDDAGQLLDDPEVNAVYIATPPKFHEEYVIAALQKGKQVYVEKPVTVSAASCKRMMAAAEQYRGKLSVAHYRRALPMFLEIKRAVEYIGKVKMIRLTLFQPHESSLIAKTQTNWRVVPGISGGGLFFDLAPHQLDILIFIFGNAIQYSGTAVHQTNFYEAEDTVSGIIRFAGNILFSGSWCFTMPESLKEDSCEIIGEKGVIKFAFFGNQVSLTNETGDETFSFIPPEHIQQPMIEKVVSYFSGNEDNPCSAAEALESLEIMEAFIKK